MLNVMLELKRKRHSTNQNIIVDFIVSLACFPNVLESHRLRLFYPALNIIGHIIYKKNLTF